MGANKFFTVSNYKVLDASFKRLSKKHNSKKL